MIAPIYFVYAFYLNYLSHGITSLSLKCFCASLTSSDSDCILYISDKDFDITLEAEPVIEVVEDDEIDPIHQQSKDDELFYEKYQQDDIDIKDYENYSKDRQTLNDYVSSINDGEKSDEIETQELVSKETVEVQEEPKEEVVLEEKVENIEDKEKVKEIVEEKIDVVENTKVEKEEVCEETVNENILNSIKEFLCTI